MKYAGLLNPTEYAISDIVPFLSFIIFEDARDLKLIEPRFTLLMKTNKIKEVDKLTSNLLVKAKSIFYTEIP